MACQNQVLRGPLHITLFFLQVLRQKAEERNPDEFYFAMEKARTRNGVHIAPTAEANKYSQEELRLMKTQDIGYLQLKAQTEAKVGAALSRKHAVGVRWGAKPCGGEVGCEAFPHITTECAPLVQGCAV